MWKAYKWMIYVRQEGEGQEEWIFLEVFVVMHVVFQEAKSCVNLKVVLLDEESFDFLVMIKRKLPLETVVYFEAEHTAPVFVFLRL